MNRLLKSKFTSKIILTIALLLPSLAFSYCPCDEKIGWDFKDDILYWTSHQSGLAFTNKPANVLTNDDFTLNHLTEPSFQWEYGFRLQLSYTLCDKSWTFNTAWIHVESKAHGSVDYNSGAPDFLGVFPVWSISEDTLPGDYVSDARMRWHLHTDIVDLNAEYNYNCCNRFFFKPFVGIRFAMLRQKFTAKYEGGTFFNGTDSNTLTENFYGAGPRGGLEVNYYLFYGFSLYGMVAIDPLFGNFRNTHHEEYLDNERFSESWNKNHFVLGFDWSSGLKWQGTILESWPDVTLGLAWEAHDFYHLNHFSTGSYDFFKHNRDLSLYGFTISAGLSF